MPTILRSLASDIEALDPRRFEGRVTGLSGALVEVSGPAEALALGARADEGQHHDDADDSDPVEHAHALSCGTNPYEVRVTCR